MSSSLTSLAFAAARARALAPAARALSTSARRQKSATEAVKDTLKTVDRAVSDKLVDGIELGESATQKVKETTAGVGVGASQAKGRAQGKAAELSGEAKGKASEVAGKAKGAAAETTGKM